MFCGAPNIKLLYGEVIILWAPIVVHAIPGFIEMENCAGNYQIGADYD